MYLIIDFKLNSFAHTHKYTITSNISIVSSQKHHMLQILRCVFQSHVAEPQIHRWFQGSFRYSSKPQCKIAIDKLQRPLQVASLQWN